MTTNANAKLAQRQALASTVAQYLAFVGEITRCPAGRKPKARCYKSAKRAARCR